MKTRCCILIAGAFGALAAPGVVRAASKVVADLQPPQKRQITVTNAERLSQRKMPPALPADTPSPFNPPDFDAGAPGNPQVGGPGGAGQRGGAGPAGGGPGNQSAPVTPVAPPGDRETLETLAAQITPSGMIQRGPKPFLAIGGKFFEVGTRFTAAYNNQDYELELVAIDRTTFTLRYRGEETTRPIKPVR